jgi:hypothetical protein
MQLDRWNEPKPLVMTTLAGWMDSWTGIGAGGRQDGAPRLPPPAHRVRENWRAAFFVTGMARSIVKGSAYEPTPWRAVKRAAWEALDRVP